MSSETEALIERLTSHMGKADVGDLLRDCRLAAKALATLEDRVARAESEREIFAKAFFWFSKWPEFRPNRELAEQYQADIDAAARLSSKRVPE